MLPHAVFLLAPFQGGGRREITHRSKCYAFDTGFVTFVKGWDSIREDDRGLLWEHLVLDTLRAVVDNHNILYWRDKSGREVDFVIKRGVEQAEAIECKINPDHFDPANLMVFRSIYPEGGNYVLSPLIKSSYQRHYGKLQVHFISIKQLFEWTGK